MSTKNVRCCKPRRNGSPGGLLCRLLLAAGIVAAPAFASDSSGPDIGFLYDSYRLTLEPGNRTEAAGPFYFHEERGSERTWGIPPFFSEMKDPDVETAEYDFLYPLFTFDRYGQQYRVQLLQLLSYSGGPTQTETNRDRFTVFPFYFQQRSSDPSENYTALFPIYGNLQNRFMRDRIHFVLFPLYSQTQRRDVVTDNYLYPFFHMRHGDKLKGWQFWPLYGQEHKEVTYRTNHWGDSQLVGGHDRYMVLWPFFHNQRNGIGSTNEQWQQATLPFYSVLRSPLRDSTTILWPFFSKIDDREKQYQEWHLPYPFIVVADGPGKQTQRVWPFFSESRSPSMQSESYMWPVYRHTRTQAEPLDRERTRLLIFLYSDLIERNTEAKTFRRRVDCWPLFTHKRDHKGNTRLQVLSILEPLTPGSHKIERDWSPVYALWRAEHNAVTGARSKSLLWNLYRQEQTPEHKKWSAFFGLLQHRQDTNSSQWRVCFVPLGGKNRSESK